MINRRQFLKLAAAAGVSLAAPRAWTQNQVFASTPATHPATSRPTSAPTSAIPGQQIPKYVEPLPVFGSAEGLEPGQVNAPRQSAQDGAIPVSMVEVQQKVLPAKFYKNLAPEYQAGTWVWAYNVNGVTPLYPGITVEARRGSPATLKYTNSLPASPMLEKNIVTDQTLHWANPLGLDMMDPERRKPYAGPPPAVTHLHGGEVPSSFDGGPEQWFTPEGEHGAAYASGDGAGPNEAIYKYPNGQEASTLWFHDHTLGATRLNVFRGLAAFYLLRDEFDTGLPDNPLRLPAGPYERELAIQDRQFDTNGQLFFPIGDPDNGLNGPPPNPLIHPFWNPEFFGDVMVVNGKSWPYLNVEPRRYRFRLLDGCNARFLELRLWDHKKGQPGPAIWVIGTDGGLLDRPAKKSTSDEQPPDLLLMAPGERYDVIIDFSHFAGRTLTLVNSAKAPYPSGDDSDPYTDGQIMQFRVNLPLHGQDHSFNPAAHGARLRGRAGQPPAVNRLVDLASGAPAKDVTLTADRLLTLLEVSGPGGPIEVLLNNSDWLGRRYDPDETPLPFADADSQGNYITELPRVGSTEIWEIVNLTMDAHPIHLHLVQFQLMNRQTINTDKYMEAYESLFPGGEFAGVTSDETWEEMEYEPHTFIPGFGPPLPYDGSDKRSGGKLGGNPDIKHFLQGKPMLPNPEEAGWKDTIKTFPGQVTRIVVRFAPQSIQPGGVAAGENKYSFDPTAGPGYVWHCHIVDHEDNEMMRPYHPVA